VLVLAVRGVPLLGINEGMHLVGLDEASLNTPHLGVVEDLELFASRLQDAQHGVPVQPGKSARGPDAYSLTKHVHDLASLPEVNPQAVQRLFFGERFAAAHALVTLDVEVFVSVMAGSFGLTLAAMTCWHLTFRGQDVGFACIRKDTQPSVSGLWLRRRWCSSTGGVFGLWFNGLGKILAGRRGWRYVQIIKGNFGCLSLVCAFSARTSQPAFSFLGDRLRRHRPPRLGIFMETAFHKRIRCAKTQKPDHAPYLP